MVRFTEADEVQTDVHSFPSLECRVQLELSARSVFRFGNRVDRVDAIAVQVCSNLARGPLLPLKRSH